MARELERLSNRHLEIIERYLAGDTPTLIATAMGLRANSVSRIIQSPLFQSIVAKRRRELQVRVEEATRASRSRVQEKLLAAGERAVQTLERLTESESESIQLKSSQEILKLAFGQGGADEGSGRPTNIGVLNIKLLESALREVDSGPVIEGELVEADVLPEPEALTPELGEPPL
jgi:hypothetical protein